MNVCRVSTKLYKAKEKFKFKNRLMRSLKNKYATTPLKNHQCSQT